MSDEGVERQGRPQAGSRRGVRRSAMLSPPPAHPEGPDAPLARRLRYSPAASVAFLDRAAVDAANYAEGVVQDRRAARRGRGAGKRDRLAPMKMLGALLVFLVSSAVVSICLFGLTSWKRLPRRLEIARGRK